VMQRPIRVLLIALPEVRHDRRRSDEEEISSRAPSGSGSSPGARGVGWHHE
jgi:hypothetical protein